MAVEVVLGCVPCTPTLLDIQGLGGVVGRHISGYSGSYKVLRDLAAKRGKVIHQRVANPCKEVNTQERRQVEGRGSKSRFRQNIFLISN